jgi:DNA polymerase
MEGQAMRQLLTDQSCARCPALVTSRRRIVHGYGDPAARIVFIGEAPGQRGADRTGVPFSGDKSGAVLQGMLAALGLALAGQPRAQPRLRCFVTNTVRCCPPRNRTPTPIEQANCAPLLADELAQIDPWLIVPVGRVALRTVGLRYLGFDPGPIRPLHARVLRAEGRTIVPLVHPARISRAQVAAFIATMEELLAPSAHLAGAGRRVYRDDGGAASLAIGVEGRLDRGKSRFVFGFGGGDGQQTLECDQAVLGGVARDG